MMNRENNNHRFSIRFMLLSNSVQYKIKKCSSTLDRRCLKRTDYCTSTSHGPDVEAARDPLSLTKAKHNGQRS